ncbi:TfoX/Sxy family transcriptional regulator of competence genes [Paraburkholderia sp. BL23I1N1]|nr:TfoX/Sxy family transcriptional regulator of competence genes [Paraburkholderia sp. BL23I1N1]
MIGPISVSRFFGGAGLVKNGVQFGFVIKGALYLRVDDLTRPDFEALGAVPFSYAGQSKTVKVASYYQLPDEIADDQHELIRWVTRAIHAAAVAKSKSQRGKHIGALVITHNSANLETFTIPI